MYRNGSEKNRGNARVVKQMNREMILQQLRSNDRLSRAQLAQQTGLSRPCVSSLIDEMIAEGMVYEVGMGQSSGGRKPILLELNHRAFLVAGAVIEGSGLHLGIADLKGDLLAECHVRSGRMTGDVVSELETVIARLLSEHGLRKSQLLGIGVGLPGITQQRSGIVSHAPSTGWMGKPLKQEIEARLGLNAVIDNDVNFMALGEFYRGVGRDVRSLVYVYVGTGIGAGIIIDGQVYRGSKEAAGEIGYMMIGPVDDLKPEAYGTFERNYSLVGLFEQVRQLDPTLKETDSATLRLIELARSGMPAAQALYENVLQHWAYGLVNIISILDPELLALSGELAVLGAEGVEQLRSLLSRWVPVVPQIEIAEAGNRAGLIGAIYSALEAFASTIAHVE
uniref:Transcriptional regulator n=1 Tax=Thermosporothrix sp. COM3 TaxID=2490863 RepID=A0A455SIK2_9CHLR|nr:transcriptional regulator [Thermosporothrix sp. COM3]